MGGLLCFYNATELTTQNFTLVLWIYDTFTYILCIFPADLSNLLDALHFFDVGSLQAPIHTKTKNKIRSSWGRFEHYSKSLV